VIDVSALKIDKGFWYLATPYSKYPAGHERAAQDAAYLAARLLARGVNVYAPIAHGHALSRACTVLDDFSHEDWMAHCLPFMEAAHGLLVAEMTQWWESDGVCQEIAWFNRAGRPAHRVCLHTLEVSDGALPAVPMESGLRATPVDWRPD
jgi:hypothetical protein